MKSFHHYILIAFMLLSSITFAQEKEYTSLYANKDANVCYCNALSDLDNAQLILARLAGVQKQNWLRQREEALKTELNGLLNTSYGSFGDAQREFFKRQYGKHIANRDLNRYRKENVRPDIDSRLERKDEAVYERSTFEFRKQEVEGQIVRESKLGDLRYNGTHIASTYDTPAEVNQVINTLTNEINQIINTVTDDYRLNLAISRVIRNGEYSNYVSQQYINHYGAQSYENRILLMMNYIVNFKDSYIHNPARFNPPLFNANYYDYTSVMESYINRELPNVQGANISVPRLKPAEAIFNFALNQEGDKVFDFVHRPGNEDLYHELRAYLEDRDYAPGYMELYRNVFRGWSRNEPIEFRFVDFTSSTPLQYIQDTGNLALQGTGTSDDLREGLQGFNNWAELLFNSIYNSSNTFNAEGSMIRKIFNDNGTDVPDFISNESLARVFDLKRTAYNQFRVDFDNFPYWSGVSFADLARLEGLSDDYFFDNHGISIVAGLGMYEELFRSRVPTNRVTPAFEEVANRHLPNTSGRIWFGDILRLKMAFCKSLNPNESWFFCYWKAISGSVHTILDAAGLVPVVGEIADITNGIIYTLEGDLVNASLSYAGAIPFAGWFATGAKYAVMTVRTVRGVDMILTFYKRADGLIGFGARSALAKVIGKRAGFEAHHIIPWAIRENPVVQKAAKFGFHMNEELNGRLLQKFSRLTGEGLHGNHPQYTDVVEFLLNRFNRNNPGASDRAAKEYLENELIPEINEWINQAFISNYNLNEYFRRVVKPFYQID